MAAASHRLITALGPMSPILHDDHERDFALLQEIIGAIRNCATKYKVDAARALTFTSSVTTRWRG